MASDLRDRSDELTPPALPFALHFRHFAHGTAPRRMPRG
jgi:hypothetical protein